MWVDYNREEKHLVISEFISKNEKGSKRQFSMNVLVVTVSISRGELLTAKRFGFLRTAELMPLGLTDSGRVTWEPRSSASTSQRDSGRGCPSRRGVRGVLGGPSRPHPGRPSGPAGLSRPYCSLRGRQPRRRHQGALGVLGGPGRLADRR